MRNRERETLGDKVRCEEREEKTQGVCGGRKLKQNGKSQNNGYAWQEYWPERGMKETSKY